MKSNKRTLGVLGAVLLALVGGLLLWNNSGDSSSEATETPAEERQVLVAARDIDAGESAANLADNAYAHVRLDSVPADQVSPNALTDVDQLTELALGRNVTGLKIPAGTQITVGHFVVPGQQAFSALPDVDENLFQTTMAIEPQRALGGNVRPGQYVAVVGSFEDGGDEPAQTVVILERVLVTNVQTEQLYSQAQLQSDPLAPSLAPTSRLFVTVGVPVDDLETLTYANEFGRIWLAHQGEEAVIDETKIRERENVVVTIDGLNLSDLVGEGEAD